MQGSKKRAATALDDGGYSSGGPMRRLRPRSFLYTPSPVRVVPKRPGLGQFSTPTTRAVQTTPMEVKQNPNTVSSLGRALSEVRSVSNSQSHIESLNPAILFSCIYCKVEKRFCAVARTLNLKYSQWTNILKVVDCLFVNWVRQWR